MTIITIQPSEQYLKRRKLQVLSLTDRFLNGEDDCEDDMDYAIGKLFEWDSVREKYGIKGNEVDILKLNSTLRKELGEKV